MAQELSHAEIVADAAQKMTAHALEVIQDQKAVAGLPLPGLSAEQLIEARDVASLQIKEATGLSRMSAQDFEAVFSPKAGQEPKDFPEGMFAMPIHINHAPVIFTPIPSKNPLPAPAPDVQVLLKSDWLALREAIDLGRSGHEASKAATMASAAPKGPK